jgi:hypothetical protein
VVIVLAVAELLVFMGVVPQGSASATLCSMAGPAPEFLASIAGMFAAIPFAIWFFLAIEGAAMAAEEAKDPKRTIPKAYVSGILTLVFLAIGVMVMAGGVGDWRQLSNINDPLPQAMKAVVGNNSSWMHMLVWIGLFGLVASFHGIILGYSRQIFALARAGYLPRPGQAVALPDAAPGDPCRRRDRHRGDLQRRPGQPARHDPDGGDDHHVGVRRHRDVHHQHAQPVQTAQNRAEPGAHLPRAGLSDRAGYRAGSGRGVPGGDGLVQLIGWFPRIHGRRLPVFPVDRQATLRSPARHARRRLSCTGAGLLAWRLHD